MCIRSEVSKVAELKMCATPAEKLMVNLLFGLNT